MRFIDPYQLADKVAESMRDNPHEGKIALNHRLEHEHFLRMIALALCKRDWENDGYTYIETISCEEIYPEAVFCTQIIKQGEVEKWLRR